MARSREIELHSNSNGFFPNTVFVITCHGANNKRISKMLVRITHLRHSGERLKCQNEITKNRTKSPI